MATMVYVLCALTSLTCAALLLRGHRRSGTRLLLWAGLCFVGLFLNNLLLVVGLPWVGAETLETWRALPALIGVSLLVYGLVWESAS